MKRTRFTKEEISDILAKYKAGMTQKEIANIYGTYNTSIRRKLIENGITPRGNSEVQRVVKSNPFVDYKTNRTAQYFIGLLATDGCIHKNAIILTLQEKDQHILQQYAKFIGYGVKVNKLYRKKYNNYEYYVKFRHLEVVEFLKSLGITERKSYNLQLNIPLTIDILRGILDGDGSIGTYNKLTRVCLISASKLFITQVSSFLSNELHVYNIVSFRQNTQLYALKIHRQKEILYLYNLLYNDTQFFIERKKLKYCPLLKKFNKKYRLNSGKVMVN